MSCEKYFVCVNCKVPQATTRNNNRLSRKKRVRLDETFVDEQDNLSRSLPSQSKQRKHSVGYSSETIHTEDEQDRLSQSLPDPEVVLHDQDTENCRECHNCHARVRYLRDHLKADKKCAAYYLKNLEGGSIDAIVDKLIRDRRNSRRAAKRREDAANGDARDRSREIDQRRNRSFFECMDAHSKAVHTMLCVPCVLCGSKFNKGKGVLKLPDENPHLTTVLAAHPERRITHRFENSWWMCKTCECMAKRLNENQSLLQCFQDILGRDENEQDNTVLVMTFEELSNLRTVYLPKLVGAPAELAVSDSEAVNLTTVMIPYTLCRLSTEESIEPEEAAFLVNRTRIDTCSLTCALYKDIDKKMKGAATKIEESEHTKVGSVENNVLFLEENKHAYDYGLQQIRCTGSHQKKLIMENLAKQNFNGKQNLEIQIDLDEIPTGLSIVLLKELNIPVVVVPQIWHTGVPYRDSMVPCQLDENSWCDVTSCDRTHQLADDRVKELYKDGLPEEMSALVSRFMHGFVQSLISNIFKKLTVHHHLQLEFWGDGSAHLVGNVWIKELEPYNESGELLKDMSVIPDFYAELGCRLLQEERSLDDFEEVEKVTDETSANLDMDVWKPVREGHLQELICLSGRGFKSVWTDQAVVKLSVINPTYMKQLFRRKNVQGDELEVTYLDARGGQWVLIPTMRVKFGLKPAPVKHVTLGQFGGWYHKPDPRLVVDWDLLRQELRENHGVSGQSDISIFTNLTKYPNELEYLPQWLELNNGKLMRLREAPAAIKPTGSLDNFGMRVLCEPFASEEELIDEQTNLVGLPSIETLSQRLKEMYPASNFEVNL